MEQHKKDNKGKQNLEFRYYEMPSDTYLMALLGERWIMNYGTDAMHFHNYLEIGYCYYGEGRMLMGQKEYNYKGSMFTVIPKNVPHCTRSIYRTVSRWEYLFIDVEGFLQRIYKDRPILVDRLLRRVESRTFISAFDKNPKAAALIRNILEEMRRQTEFYKESVRGYLLALLVELARKVEEPEFTDTECTGEERIARVLDHIAKHYAGEIRISDLADMCHVSETHFRRMFEKITNTTPVEYINMIRVQNACTLLTETTDSIEKIREKVGFPTASTFNRNFKRLVKMSPGKWRRQKEGKLTDYKISIYKGW